MLVEVFCIGEMLFPFGKYDSLVTNVDHMHNIFKFSGCLQETSKVIAMLVQCKKKTFRHGLLTTALACCIGLSPFFL